MSCPKTAIKTFPHHWKCIQTEGHIGCTCNNIPNKYCSSYECRLEDGSRRVPDGSIAVRDHLEQGKIAVARYDMNKREVDVVIL
jgi:hypothetical protein